MILSLAMSLREVGIASETFGGGNLGKRLKKADKNNVRWVVLIGCDEVKMEKALVRDLKTGEQTQVSFGGLGDYFHVLANGV